MNCKACHGSLLVIVHDLNVGRPHRIFRPLETNPPLVVNADAVLALPVRSQRLKTVAGQGGKIPQRHRRCETMSDGSAGPLIAPTQRLLETWSVRSGREERKSLTCGENTSIVGLGIRLPPCDAGVTESTNRQGAHKRPRFLNARAAREVRDAPGGVTPRHARKMRISVD